MGQVPNYHHIGGLRKVDPYYFTFKTHVKSRWLGRNIVDVFTTEFGQTASIVRGEIFSDLIYVITDYKRANCSTIKGNKLLDWSLKGSDLICNSRHMHETPVHIGESAGQNENCPNQHKTDIGLIYENEDLVVINKPAGIPAHPKGNFRYNTVTEILKHDLQLENVWPCHRLDKMTSGIMILGKNKETGAKLLRILEHEKDCVKKVYLARVKGKFIEGKVDYQCPVFRINSSGGYIMPTNASSMSSYSCTSFELLEYNEELDQSIILCTPLTGRMHQIRIHLRNLGHPIANDYLYNPEASTSLKRHINEMRNQLEKDLYNSLFQKMPMFKMPNAKTDLLNANLINLHELTCFGHHSFQQKIKGMIDLRNSWLSEAKGNHNQQCPECGRQMFDIIIESAEMQIWLHALSYTYSNGTKSFEYKTPLPSWCHI